MSLVAALAATACGFFEELQSADSVGDTGEDTDGETETDGTGEAPAEGEPCEVALHDRCADQDTLWSCEPAVGTLTIAECDALCGGLVNFTCVRATTGQHGCYCIDPGTVKVYSCVDLEDCIGGCSGDAGACAQQCFSRTTETTARMFGALLHCAESACEDDCRDAPQACAACIDETVATGGRGCSLPRAVCDGDRSDDEWP